MNLPAPKSGSSLPADYEIQRILGSGANGLVYLARDGAGQLCAVKEFAVSGDVAQRFFREASIVFTLVHDNIVRCQNLLYGSGGRSYLVFEYVEGGTLRDRIGEGEKLPVREALDLLRQLCLGLQHAHEARVIHCDLKPENILLAPDADGVRYKIADLGIARYSAEASDAPGTAGSPAYMAPEQFYGRTDERSDIYSLGIIFYEILSGQRPFDGTPVRLFSMHAQEQPDLSLVPDAGCARLLSLMLAKQPAARPASCAEVIAQVEALLQPGLPDAAPAAANAEPDAPLFDNTPYVWRGGGFQMEVRGAGRMLPLFAGGGTSVLVSDERSTDMIDLQSRRVRPHVIPGEVTCVSNGTASGPLLLAGSRGIHSFENGSQRLLFPHPARVVALAHDPVRGRVLTATMRRIHCWSVNGTSLWQAPAPNYCRPPALLAASTGEVIYSTGPVYPTLRICSQSGVVREEIQARGPVLALRDEGGDGRFGAVEQGLGADAPARFTIYSGKRIESEVDLGTGVYHATWHGNLLSLHFTDGRIQLLGAELTPLWEHRCDGVALTDVWHPRLHVWVVLERHAGSVWMRSFPLTNAGSPAVTE